MTRLLIALLLVLAPCAFAGTTGNNGPAEAVKAANAAATNSDRAAVVALSPNTTGFIQLVVEDASGNGNIVGYDQGDSSVPVAVQNFPQSTNGVGTSTGTPVIQMTEISRQIVISSATGVAAAAAETLFTLNTSTGLVNGTSGTSFGVPAGKVFKIETFQCSWNDSALADGSGFCHLRAQASGPCTASSPIIAEVANTGQNSGVAAGRPIADRDGDVDVNLSGSMTFCATHLEANTGPTVNVVIRGFQY